MSLGTYAQLQAAVATVLARSDLTAQIVDWITLFEQEMNLILCRREMTKRLVFSTVANQDSYVLPGDYGSGISLHRNDSPIEVMDPSDWDRIKLLFTATGAPLQWCYNQNKIMLGPTPDAVYSMELYYYANLPNLSTTNTVNWLLTAHPEVYYYGVLNEAVNAMVVSGEYAQRWSSRWDATLKKFLYKMAKDRNLGGGPLLRTEWPLARSGFNITTGEYQ